MLWPLTLEPRQKEMCANSERVCSRLCMALRVHLSLIIHLPALREADPAQLLTECLHQILAFLSLDERGKKVQKKKSAFFRSSRKPERNNGVYQNLDLGFYFV